MKDWTPMVVALTPLALALVLVGTVEAAEGGRWADPGPFRDAHGKSGWDSGPGDPTAEFLPARDPGWRPGPSSWTALGPEFRLGLGYGAHLNRVDGLSVLASQEVENRSSGPSFSFYESYGFSSEEWSGAAEARIGSSSFSLGARWADETIDLALPRQPLSPKENFLAALMVRRDFGDYYRRESRTYFAEYVDTGGNGLTLAFRDERHESATRSIRKFGWFGGKSRFRLNPEIDEGSWNVLQARARWSGREEPSVWGPAAGTSLLLDAQFSGGDLGDGRVFTRIWGECRSRVRLTSHQQISIRLTAGGTPEGSVDSRGSRLPLQWQFQAGGVGSLRGHEFQAFRGDRLLLGTLEYGLDFDTAVRPVLFFDAGKAWNESDGAVGGVSGSGELAVDGGVGFLLGSDGLRIDVARDLRSRHAPARVTIRLFHAI